MIDCIIFDVNIAALQCRYMPHNAQRINLPHMWKITFNYLFPVQLTTKTLTIAVKYTKLDYINLSVHEFKFQ